MYRWVEHTAEVELEIEADTEEAVFADALDAFVELLGEPAALAAATHRIELESADRAGLLAEFIEELLYLGETRGFIPRELASIALGPDTLTAEVAGSAGNPPHVVKAVTYHRLGFEPVGNKVHARVILDV